MNWVLAHAVYTILMKLEQTIESETPTLTYTSTTRNR